MLSKKIKTVLILLGVAFFVGIAFWFWQKDNFSPKLNQNIQEKLKTELVANDNSQHNHYVPAYFDEVEYIFCSNKSSINGEAGEYNKYPCSGNKFGKNYFYKKRYSGGFREKFNPNDPIIIYQTDELSGEEDEKSNARFSFQMQNPAYPNGNKLNPEIFSHGNALDSRLFLSPGLKGLLLAIQPTQGRGMQTVIGRFGQPPLADFPPGSSKDDWSNYQQNYVQYPQYFPPEVYSSGNPWADVMNVRLEYYKKYDLLTFQYGGNDHVAIRPNHEEMTNEGGWLYLKFKDWGSSDPLGYSGYWEVDIKTYAKWYDCMEAKDGWDSSGDPKPDFNLCDASSLPGDIEPQSSPDGDVDIFDYNVFIQYWSQSPTNNPADIDQNGKVDIFDYNLLVGNFGKTSGQ